MYGLTFLEWFYFVIHVFASLFFHIHCPDVFISFWQQLLSWKHVMNQMNPTHEWSWKTGETLVCRVKVKAMWSATLAVPWSQHWGVCVPFAFVRFVMSVRPTLLFHNQRVMFTTNFMPFYLVSWKWFNLTDLIGNIVCLPDFEYCDSFTSFFLNFLILSTTGKKSLSNLTQPLEQCDLFVYCEDLCQWFMILWIYATAPPIFVFLHWLSLCGHEYIIRICKCQCIKVKKLVWSEN